MKTDLHSRVANEFALLEKDARAKRERYAVNSTLWSYFDGQAMAFMDLRIRVKNGDFSPLDDASTPAASWERRAP